MAKVEDLLRGKTKKAISVRPDTTVLDALRVMAEENIGAVPVMSDDQLEGIFSERDHARRTAEQGGYSPEIPVSEVMTKRVFYVDRDASMNQCMAQMTDKRVRHLPVIDNDKVVGVISIGDVVRTMIGEYQQLVASLETYIAGSENPL